MYSVIRQAAENDERTIGWMARKFLEEAIQTRETKTSKK